MKWYWLFWAGFNPAHPDVTQHSGDYSQSVAVKGVVSVQEKTGHRGSLMTWMASAPGGLYPLQLRKQEPACIKYNIA